MFSLLNKKKTGYVYTVYTWARDTRTKLLSSERVVQISFALLFNVLCTFVHYFEVSFKIV